MVKMVILKEINDENFYKLVKMERQEHVAPNVFSIAQAYLFPEVKPRAIYNEENELVGFVMYGPEPDQNDQIWIWRLSIDVPFQRKGYGRATVKKVIENVLEEYPEEKQLWLSTGPDNDRAINLYTSLGFKDTGKIEYDEKVYVLELKK
jgi:diamine N-acetyltransferase